MEITAQTLNKLYGICKQCNWVFPDTCRNCGAKNKAIVISVNKTGIKGR